MGRTQGCRSQPSPSPLTRALSLSLNFSPQPQSHTSRTPIRSARSKFLLVTTRTVSPAAVAGKMSVRQNGSTRSRVSSNDSFTGIVPGGTLAKRIGSRRGSKAESGSMGGGSARNASKASCSSSRRWRMILTSGRLPKVVFLARRSWAAAEVVSLARWGGAHLAKDLLGLCLVQTRERAVHALVESPRLLDG